MFTKHAIEPDFTCLQAKQPPHLEGYNHHQIELRLLENAPFGGCEFIGKRTKCQKKHCICGVNNCCLCYIEKYRTLIIIGQYILVGT